MYFLKTPCSYVPSVFLLHKHDTPSGDAILLAIVENSTSIPGFPTNKSIDSQQNPWSFFCQQTLKAHDVMTWFYAFYYEFLVGLIWSRLISAYNISLLIAVCRMVCTVVCYSERWTQKSGRKNQVACSNQLHPPILIQAPRSPWLTNTSWSAPMAEK